MLPSITTKVAGAAVEVTTTTPRPSMANLRGEVTKTIRPSMADLRGEVTTTTPRPSMANLRGEDTAAAAVLTISRPVAGTHRIRPPTLHTVRQSAPPTPAGRHPEAYRL